MFSAKLNKDIIENYVNIGNLTKKKHPIFDIWIYNYTNRCQYLNLWDNITINCRGLVLDSNYDIIARPFTKFFNIEEHNGIKLPLLKNEPYTVYEKLDGSLGILFCYNGKWIITTRGDFESYQANFANSILNSKYKHKLGTLDKNLTYLFEIICEKKVVDYKDTMDIFLIANIETKTGEEVPLTERGFCLANKYTEECFGIDGLRKLKELDLKNKEGFVVKFKSGTRVKIKFDSYILLSKAKISLTPKNIWLILKDGKEKEFLSTLDDELYEQYIPIRDNIVHRFNEILIDAINFYHGVLELKLKSRKEIAEKVKTFKYPNIIFNLIDKNYKKIKGSIWNIIKPK